jgi:D-alanyl-D-alanine carboxypeptidase
MSWTHRVAWAMGIVALFAVEGSAAEWPGEVDRLAEAWLAEAGVAGLTLAIEHGDKHYTQGYGQADLEFDVPMNTDAILRIGSITKVFTATAIMKLEAAGKLQLSDEITKYLPDYPTHGTEMTLWHLLTHTAGIPNYTDYCNYRLDYSHKELLNVFKNRALEFPPGEGWNYSNSGYYLLGLVIEKVSGKSYAEYIEDAICKPAGLTRTMYGHTAPIVEGRSHGYVRDGDTFKNVGFVSMAIPYSAGALCSTAEDLLRFRAALADGTLLPESSFKRMISTAAFPNGDPLYYSFGFIVAELDGHRKACHEGGIDGFVSQIAYYPDDDLTIVVLMNTEGGEATRLERQIARALLGLPEPAPVDKPLEAAEAKKWAGEYRLGARTVHVTERDGNLLMKVEGMMPFNLPLLYQGDGFFVLKADPDVMLRFDEAESEGNSLLLQFGDIRAQLSKSD